MKVTVCELPADADAFEDAWSGLEAHARAEATDLVLLPEMPFHRWLPLSDRPSREAWDEAVAAHRSWIERLPDLSPAAVAGTRPVIREGRRLNESFLWSGREGERAVHAKRNLPDEPGFWEASWYERGPGRFETAPCGGARVGFLICTELWFFGHARRYAADGVHLLLCPRATPAYSEDKWLAAGRSAAVVAGAFGLSSNRSGNSEPDGGGGEDGGASAEGSSQAGRADPAGTSVDVEVLEWAGRGWIVGPDGDVLGVTSRDEPYLTRDVDLAEAEEAKETYPRCVEA